MEAMQGNETVAQKLVEFTDSAIQNASGGLVAGIGVLFLIWTAVRLLAEIENALNEIWGIKKGRSWRRKFCEYLTLLIVYPFLLVIMVSSNTFLIGRLEALSGSMPDPGIWNTATVFIIHAVHLLAAWSVFFFIYFFGPNTRVRFKPAAISGLLVAVCWLTLQWGYVFLQTKLTSYNAIYGSFAALPFFLLWANIGWTVVIIGAQLSFAIQNVNQYEMEPMGSQSVSTSCRKLCALRIMKLAVQAFVNHKEPYSAEQLSRELEIPILTARSVIDDLCETGFLVMLMHVQGRDDQYQVGIPPAEITPLAIFHKLDDLGFAFQHPENAKPSVDQIGLFWNNADGRLSEPVVK